MFGQSIGPVRNNAAYTGMWIAAACLEDDAEFVAKIVIPPIFRAAVMEITRSGKTVGTQKNMITALRKAATEAVAEAAADQRIKVKLNSAILEATRLPLELVREFKTGEEIRKVGRAHGRVVISDADAAQIVARAIRFLRSSDPAERFVGLACITGRRPVEIVPEHFSPIPVSRDGVGGWWVEFSGQAKTRQEAPPPPYLIPLLVSECDTHMQAFRQALKACHVRVSQTACRPAVADLVHELWPEEMGEPTLQKLRGFHACYTYFLYADAGRQQWHWINEVLGHTDGDTETPQTYDRWLITKEPDHAADAEAE